MIIADGVQFYPCRIECIVKMTSPQMSADWQQSLCAIQRMRAEIRGCSSITSHLVSFHEQFYSTVSKRTQLTADGVSLTIFRWTSDQGNVFQRCNRTLVQQATLAHVDAEKALYLYVDASDYFWSEVTLRYPLATLH